MIDPQELNEMTEECGDVRDGIVCFYGKGHHGSHCGFSKGKRLGFIAWFNEAKP